MITWYCQLLTSIILSVLVLAGFLLLYEGRIILEAELLYRLLLFTGFSLLYFFIWLLGSVVVSACYSYSRNALVTLLGIWIFSCILLPKAAANIGAGLFPGVTKAQMDAAVHEETLKGIDGHDPQNQRTEELKLVLLKKYGVDSVSQLPVNVDGLIMAAGEEYSSQVYQKHFAQLVNTYHKQNQVSVWAGYLNPYLAIRTISMGLAASDFNHFVHFQQAAENYRYQLVQRLNYLQTNKLRPGDKTFRLSRETWREFAPFHYQAPPVSWSLTSQIWSLVALLTWVVALTWWGLNKINSINILT